MKNVFSQYPALRASIYGVVAGTLTIAAIFGIVTQEQLDAVLVNTGLGLGAVGSLLAILNLNGKKDDPATGTEPALATPDVSIDYDYLAAKVQERITPGINEALSVGTSIADTFIHDAGATVQDLRRQVEQAFGEHRG